MSIIKEEIDEFQNRKIIIFTQYREMAENLKHLLSDEFINKLVVEKFIGQTTKVDDCGFPQYKQIEILQNFREDKINVLVATSVAEEGLDIPNVDAIIFYEPVPSEIRLIQRRGRTGRSAPGRCYILIASDTVDIPFYVVANRKEQVMNSVLQDPEQLELNSNISRTKIKFSKGDERFSEIESVRNFQERRAKEKELLADRSIEEIISQLDKFSNSKEYKKLRQYGVSFMSDCVKLDKKKLQKTVLKMKGKKDDLIKPKKRYLNRNVKALIDIAKVYSNEGKISFKEFQNLAEEEDLTERKFYVHFNQACYLGYLKRQTDCVQLVKDYDE